MQNFLKIIIFIISSIPIYNLIIFIIFHIKITIIIISLNKTLTIFILIMNIIISKYKFNKHLKSYF